MSHDLSHPADFLLAQRCLEGNTKAIRQFQEENREAIIAYLRGVGAVPEEAEEETEWLWADCLKERPGRSPRLATYTGQASLKTWLSALALNRLLARKHRQNFRDGIVQSGGDEEWRKIPQGEDSAEAEAPLLDLLKSAIEASFQRCRPEHFVLLQLAHVDQLQMVELARMFNCSKSTVHRNLVEAGKSVADATLEYVRQVDPWLVLTWKDFMELCQVASPSCFGLE